jgi:DNA-binding NarL/FixJ family response regulator
MASPAKESSPPNAPSETHSRAAVVLVEDDAMIRTSWMRILNRMANFRCTGAYASGEEALEEIPKIAPNLALMDIRLPGISGIECARALKRLLPGLEIIMLTMFADSDLIFEALRAGASGYLLKRTTPADLRQALEQARNGGAPMSPQIARQIVQFFQHDKPARSESGNETTEKLSSRETAILQLLAEGRPYKEIADHLEISMDTVRTYIRRAYHKLHVHSRTDAVVKYLGVEPSGPR